MVEGASLIWSYIASSGPGQIAIIEEEMISQVYQGTLQDNARVDACQLKLKRRWVMQQDIDPKHQSKSTTA